MPVFPKRSKPVYLTYSENFSLSTGAASAGTYVFVANGMYDPNLTGTGHQPMGFDQMMQFYYHYTVIRSRLKIYFRNTDTAISPFAGISYNGSSTPITNDDQLIEKGMIDFVQLSAFPNTGYHRVVERAMDLRATTGVNDLMDNDESRGDNASNPTEGEYFHISVWNPDSVSVAALRCTAVLEFEAIFTEPRAMVES